MARDLVLEVVEQVRGNALGEAARDLDTVAGKTDRASGAATDYTKELKLLDQQLAASKLRLQQLGAEFAATKDKATGKDLRGERSLIAQLEKIRKELEDAAPTLVPVGLFGGAGAKAGAGFSSGFMDTLAELPAKVKGSTMVAVVAAVAAASPMIGATISGAVLGGVGLGGIAGGIGAASKDPAVRAAASSFGQDIAAEFFGGGGAFVQPTIDSLDILEQAFQDMDFGSSWERVAPFVTRIADGIAGLGREFMPGFNRALDAAGPGLVILGEELPEIGAALGDMIAEMAESEGALEGLQFTLDAVESTLRFTGDAVAWLSSQFHQLIGLGIEVADVMEELPTVDVQTIFGLPSWTDFKNRWQDLRGEVQQAKFGLQEADDVGHRWTRNMNLQGEAATLLAEAVARLNEEQSEYLDNQLSVDKANQRVHEVLLTLAADLKENGKEWRANTEAGQANRQLIINTVDAFVRQRQANIDAGMSAEEATAKFEHELDALTNMAVKAGITKEALDDLIGDYYVRINVSATVTGGDPYSQALRRALKGKESISGFAAGGYPPMDEPFWVGEGGRPELMILSPRPRVFSNTESRAMVAGGSAVAQKTAEALSTIAVTLDELRRRQPPIVNVYATPSQSPQELTAVVARELAWSS
jgi:hypothetical protein